MAYKTFANGFPLPASDLNNYLMNQSVIVFADSTARSAALPTPTEGMITYLEDTNNYQYWDGAAWEDLVTAPDLSTLIPKSTVTTAGDLIVADGASSVTRLGVGTDDQVLTLVSGAPAWADAGGGGGMTLLSTTSVSGNSAVTVSSIDQTYKKIALVGKDLSYTGGGSAFQLKINNSNSYNALSGADGYSVGSRAGFGTLSFGNVPDTQNVTFYLEFMNYSQVRRNVGFGCIIIGDEDIANIVSADLASRAITSFTITFENQTFDNGTLEVWGIN
jgi:hypothetical protein